MGDMKLTRRQFFKGLLASTAMVAVPTVVALGEGVSPNQAQIDGIINLLEYRIKRAEQYFLENMAIDLYGDTQPIPGGLGELLDLDASAIAQAPKP